MPLLFVVEVVRLEVVTGMIKRGCSNFVLAVPESQGEREAAIAASDKFCGLTFGGVSEWGCRDVALSHAFKGHWVIYMFEIK